MSKFVNVSQSEYVLPNGKKVSPGGEIEIKSDDQKGDFVAALIEGGELVSPGKIKKPAPAKTVEVKVADLEAPEVVAAIDAAKVEALKPAVAAFTELSTLPDDAPADDRAAASAKLAAALGVAV